MRNESLSRILRDRRTDLLGADLVDLLVEGESEWVRDDRDLEMALAPYHDCARQLDMDPAALFRLAAEAGPPSLRSVVIAFGERTDISPGSFGFQVVDGPHGPEYRVPGPTGEQVVDELRSAGFLDEED